MGLSVKANDYNVKQKNRELISESSKMPEEVAEIRTNPQMQSIWGFANLVEPRGIEPLSEGNLEGTSPGAVCYLHSLLPAGTNTLRQLVAS